MVARETTAATKEVSCVEWNLLSKDVFASASWDGTIRIWSPVTGASLRTFHDHSLHPVYGKYYLGGLLCSIPSLDNYPHADRVYFGALSFQ